jgi:hypothetical protein
MKLAMIILALVVILAVHGLLWAGSKVYLGKTAAEDGRSPRDKMDHQYLDYDWSLNNQA